jgi:hypothetical protein
MSTAFELQIYQNGQWQFDSYFDDKDTVVSEAERMNASGRYSGVRVLEETYKEGSNACEYHVIFSRLGKDSGASNWRDRYQSAGSTAKPADDEDVARRLKPKHRPQPRKKSSPIGLIAVASVIVLLGIAAVIGLRSIAGTS